MSMFAKKCFGAALTGVVAMSTAAGIHAAQIPPPPANPRWAQTSLGFNPKTSCPDLRMADEGTIAVIVFWLPSSGIPAKISVKTSSGSNSLDSAAVDCVTKLRFAAATTLGTGDPIDSWQQVAFRWADRGQSLPSERGNATASVAGASAQAAAHIRPDNAATNTVTVHVCADETGRLEHDPTIVHSSGIDSLDQAALRIAASGSSYYRPVTSSGGPPVSGCAQLAIKFDTQ